jgi:hypothetical protein
MPVEPTGTARVYTPRAALSESTEWSRRTAWSWTRGRVTRVHAVQPRMSRLGGGSSTATVSRVKLGDCEVLARLKPAAHAAAGISSTSRPAHSAGIVGRGGPACPPARPGKERAAGCHQRTRPGPPLASSSGQEYPSLPSPGPGWGWGGGQGAGLRARVAWPVMHPGRALRALPRGAAVRGGGWAQGARAGVAAAGGDRPFHNGRLESQPRAAVCAGAKGGVAVWGGGG